MNLILVRHGQSVANERRRFEGTGDFAGSPLSGHGRRQVGQLALYLANACRAVARVYASPALRARETADILRRSLHAPLTIAGELSEIDCGDWAGEEFEAVELAEVAAWSCWKRQPTEFRFPGGESLAQVERRVAPLLDRILARPDDDTLILVSHGATLTVILSLLFGWDLKSAWADRRSYHPTSAMTELEIGRGAPILLSPGFGCRPHLERVDPRNPRQ